MRRPSSLPALAVLAPLPLAARRETDITAPASGPQFHTVPGQLHPGGFERAS